MEYEKHIKRLVLGYLKNECKSAYKIFLKGNFQNQDRHVPTRVAGQTLEDILRIYSRIQDIIQGRLEDTEYYKEYGVEVSSPVYLAEQLLYLLDRGRAFTPVSTICDRSPVPSSIADTQHENEEIIDLANDLETTPEHSLPGNIYNSDDNHHPKTPFRGNCTSPICRTPYMKKLPTSEQENISSVMKMTLLEKKEFHKKLAHNINSAFYTPEPMSSRKDEHADKSGHEAVLEDPIKNALNKTEADPMFQELLNDLLGSVGNTIGKVVNSEAVTSSSSSSTTNSVTPSKSVPCTEVQKGSVVSPVLTVPNGNNCSKSDSSRNNESQNENVRSPTPVTAKEQPCISLLSPEETPASKSAGQATQLGSITSTPSILHTPSRIYTLPTTTINQAGNQQQQFFIVNQPLVIPQPSLQLIQPVQTISKPMVIDQNRKLFPKVDGNLTEQDIMSMPTIILNERNEIAYADPSNLTGSTPRKPDEVHNITEYFNVFGSSEQSPIIKLHSKKPPLKELRPAPTINFQITHRDTPHKNVEEVDQSKNGPNRSKELPNLCEPVGGEVVPDTRPQETSNKETTKSAPVDVLVISSGETKVRSTHSVCTPSPLITTNRKPTPKSSSHIRNLTFPSPVRKTSDEKPNTNRSSPSILSKQQATKDLFKNKPAEETKKSRRRASPRKRSRSDKAERQKSSSPKKSRSPRKSSSPKKASPSKKLIIPLKKISEDTKKETKTTCERKTPESWDAALRRNIVSVENESTPVRRASARNRVKRSTDLDVTDADGKKLEEALKSPLEKPKGKTPSRKKTPKSGKGKTEKKLAEIEEEANVETKKILSPSKLCHTASKRNMEVDGITPNTTKETSHQLISNARKNITSLLETPLKKDELPTATEANIDPAANTPFTPMLKANLKGLTVGDTFAIDTPNFPVTPGLSLMETSTTTAYYILNGTETDKATEAIVLSEEKKSSVRKTDDEDVEASPKVYGCRDILDDFNKSRAGKKNLELLDSRGVKWDGNSDRDDKSDNSETSSDAEPNSTVIQNTNVPIVLNNNQKTSRAPGKSMAALKSRTLDNNKDPGDHLDEYMRTTVHEDGPSAAAERDQPNEAKIFNQIISKKGGNSSSDSEVVSKEIYENRLENILENKTEKDEPDKDIKKAKKRRDSKDESSKTKKDSSRDDSKSRKDKTSKERNRRSVDDKDNKNERTTSEERPAVGVDIPKGTRDNKSSNKSAKVSKNRRRTISEERYAASSDIPQDTGNRKSNKEHSKDKNKRKTSEERPAASADTSQDTRKHKSNKENSKDNKNKRKTSEERPAISTNVTKSTKDKNKRTTPEERPGAHVPKGTGDYKSSKESTKNNKNIRRTSEGTEHVKSGHKSKRTSEECPVISADDPKVTGGHKPNKENTPITVSSITTEIVRQAVATTSLDTCANCITSAFSVKAEMDEKRKRVVELEKAQATKTPSRRKNSKSQPNPSPSSNKRKRSQPKKLLGSTEMVEQQRDINGYENVDSQDEFFKKSGSNLHRRNKQATADSVSEKAPDLRTKEKRMEAVISDEIELAKVLEGDITSKIVPENIVAGNLDLQDEPMQHDTVPDTIDETKSVSSDDIYDAWNTSTIELQPEEIVIQYDEKNASTKRLEDYDLTFLKKAILADLPLADGSTYPVVIAVAPFKMLWEIPATASDNLDDVACRRATPECSSDSEHAGFKVGESGELKCAKKRKNRSDSCSSTSSSKKMKTSLYLNENNIEKLLTKLHGPSEKT